MRLQLLPGLAALALCSCSDDPVTPGPSPDPVPVPLQWIADFTSAGAHGTLLADVVVRSGAVEGEVVFRELETGRQEHLFVRGTHDGSRLHLELDRDRVPYVFDFTLDADVDGAGALSGTMAFSPSALAADLAGRLLERGSVALTASVIRPSTVVALAFDGRHVWLSTPGHDYLLLNPDATDAGAVTVFYGSQAHWTSSALTFDGTNLWGFLPVTVIGPGGPHNESKLLEFTATGNIVNEVSLGHRTAGLAYDGTDFRSLDPDSRWIYRFDRSGAVLDSVDVEVPDAVYLEFDGAGFWTLGWFVQKLYRLDGAGRIREVYDPPDPGGFFGPAGLALDGSALWYGRTDPFDGVSWIARLEPTL